MAELVNEIVDKSVYSDLERVKKDLADVTNLITELNAESRKVKLDLGASDSLKKNNEDLNKSKQITEQLTSATKFYQDTVKATDQIIAQHNGHSKEFAQVLKGVEDANLKAARAEDVRARTAARTAKQIEREKERERKATEKLNNAYEQLKVKYNQASAEAKRLAVEAENVATSLGKESKEYKVLKTQADAAAASSMKMYNSLLAVEKSVGQAQRQVGRYNVVSMEMSQVLRELPNFAMGARIGILSLSNNIPMLAESIKKLIQTNKELKATGAEAIPVWKTLLKSITSPVGLITLATTALTFLAVKTDLFKSKAEEASDATKEFEDSLKSLNTTMKHLNRDIALGIEDETQKAKILLGVYNDSRTTLIGRINTYEELQGMYPKVLSALTDEEKATGALNLAHVKQIATLNEVIRTKIHLNSIDESLAAERKTKADANEILRQQANTFSDATKRAIRRAIRAQGDMLVHPTIVDPAAGVDNAAVNAYLDTRDKVLAAERKIAEFEKFKYEYTLKYANLQTNIDEDNEKKSSKKEAILKGDEELLKAQYDLAKQRVEQDRDNQKDITDNVKEELQKRLDAHLKYQSDLLQLADMEAQLEIDIEEVKINKLKEQRKKATSAAERKDIDKQITAAFARQLAAEEDYNQKANKITLDGRKKVLSIIKSSNEEWLQIQSDSFEARKQAEIQQYLREGFLLKDALEKREITRREYERKIKELKRKQHISALQAEVEYDKRLLKNEELTAKQRLAILKKLNKDEEALLNATSNGSSKRKGNFRVTDSIAKLLGGGAFDKAGLDEQEKYLEAFYSASVNLARSASDAIMEINHRRFQAELTEIQRLQDQNNLRYQDQINVINITAKNEIEKKTLLSEASAQYQAQEADFEQQKRRIAVEQARFQRTSALASAISNTAVGVTKALAELGPLAAVVVPLIAAAGAAQIATIASAPIPAYKDGTLNHTGGVFFAGDGGERELIMSPNKAPYWSDSSTTLYNEPKGTKVLPESMLKQAAYYTIPTMTPKTERVAMERAIHRNDMEFAVAKVVGRQFKEVGVNLAEVIWQARSKPTDLSPIASELRKANSLQSHR